MFQDFALFPHLNVRRNVMFGLKGLSRQEKQQRVDEVLELVGLSAFKKRAVTELSGGEQQRVALARSLAPRPQVLMLDEPLGSLDAALRERLVVELRQILQQSGTTALYVTHDQQEAFAIADRIAVMNAGRIEQIAPPEALYKQPKTEFVARFLGFQNIVPGEDGESVLLHPAYANLLTEPAEDAIPVTVANKVFRGSQVELTLHSPHGELTVQVPLQTNTENVQAVRFNHKVMLSP
jgi:ABC-type Fe3+/spermidine/putrescine transport system ATPase subunit